MSRRVRWAILALYLAGLVGATLAPLPDSYSQHSGLDKWIHAALFGGLAFLAYWNLQGNPRITFAALSAMAAAAMIEILQIPLPYRSGDVWDFAAGTAGAVMGALLASRLVRDFDIQ